MFVLAGMVLLIACAAFALVVLRRRVRWERPPELDEALEQVRERVRGPRAAIVAACVIGLAIVAMTARNPSRWAVMLLALALVAAATAVYVVRERRGGGGRG